MEVLEARLLFSTPSAIHPHVSSATIAARTVTLQRVDGAGGPLVGDRNTWILIHGLGGSASSVAELARAVDSTTGDDQVLAVDWSQLASVPDNTTAVNNTRVVADTLAARLKQLGLSAAHINLIGFSAGALVGGRLAGDLHGIGGINRFIALDPVTPDTSGGTPTLNLAADSRYSIAFHANGNYNYAANTSADDSILIDNLGSGKIQRHQGVFDLFVKMTEMNASGTPDAVSAIFSLTRIETGGLPGWRKNSYSGGYEAVLTASPAPNLAQHALQYRVSRFAHTVTISA